MNMVMFLLFVLVATFEGIIGEGEHQTCMEKHRDCNRMVPDQDISEMMKTTGPNADALVRLCPPVLQYLNCTMEHYKVCRDRDYENSESMYIVAREGCDDQSRLHKVYVRNIDCVFLLKEAIEKCTDEAYQVTKCYKRYRESLGEDYAKENSTEKWEKIRTDNNCLENYLFLGCSANKIEKKCGREATDTFLEIAIRSRLVCAPESMQEMQKRYLEMMDNDLARLIDLPRILKYSYGGIDIRRNTP